MAPQCCTTGPVRSSRRAVGERGLVAAPEGDSVAHEGRRTRRGRRSDDRMGEIRVEGVGGGSIYSTCIALAGF
ncbi:MAG: hypothetical protein CMJ89_12525 [Planctomycetes bacterium]|nr:hypothetical protein [Planctomycetota bacterium]